MRNLTADEKIQRLTDWRENWDWFIEDKCGLRTWSGMRLIIDSVQRNKRTSVRACHGISKTITASALGVTFLNLYKPSIIITTAPTNTQVKNLLWKEIGSIYRKNLDRDLAGQCNMQEIRINPDWYMLGFSTDKPYRMEGFHDANILWILDEAKGLENWLFDVVEGSMTGGQARILELSTTDGADQQCAFRKHHSEERTDWNCIQLSAYDSPFVNPSKFKKEQKFMNQDLFDFGRPRNKTEWDIKLADSIQITNPEDIADKKKMWFLKRPELWETKILGEFSTSGENNLIPLNWVMSAVNAEVDAGDKSHCYGFDVARMGNDNCVLTEKEGKTFYEQELWGKKRTMETVGIIRTKIDENDLIKVDACGLGAGVFDRLAELGQPTIGLDSAAKAFDDVKFFNLRAEMWWCARELFEKQYEEGNTVSIPDDPELIEDLTGLKYQIKSDGRIIAEPKADFKKRLSRSPDKGDSFVYCAYTPIDLIDEYWGESEEEDGDEIIYI
jgi:hypothetical protein